MNDWKALVKKMLFIPVPLMVVLVLLSAVGLALVFIMGWDTSPIAYVVYVLSFYALTTLCLFCWKRLPACYKELKQKVYDHPYGNKYMTDVGYKVRVSLYISLGINLVYSIFKLVSGIVYSTFWWGAIAVYYIVLSVIRFLLLNYMQGGRRERDLAAEYRRYRLCGILMVLLNLTLTGVVLHMLFQNKEYVSNEILVIASATYTFYTVTVSIIDIIKYRKHDNPVYSASKAIRLASALVSLLSLETSMLVQFGEDEAFRRLMTALTGAGVCVFVLAMSVYMIVRATKEIKKIETVKE